MGIKLSVDGVGGGQGWFTGFQDMAEKTVLRQLLTKWGELSVDAAQVINADERPTAIQQRDEEFAEDKKVIVVDAETGEVKMPENSATDAIVQAPAETQTSSHRKLS